MFQIYLKIELFLYISWNGLWIIVKFKKNKYVFSKSPSNVKNDDDSLKTRSSQISLLVKEIFLYIYTNKNRNDKKLSFP